MTVLDIGLRVVCNDKDGCVSGLEAVGSDYRGFSFQRFPGTVSEGYGMLSKSVEARKGRIASPEQRAGSCFSHDQRRHLGRIPLPPAGHIVCTLLDCCEYMAERFSLSDPLICGLG